MGEPRKDVPDKGEMAMRMLAERRRKRQKGSLIIHTDDKGNVPKIETHDVY